MTSNFASLFPVLGDVNTTTVDYLTKYEAVTVNPKDPQGRGYDRCTLEYKGNGLKPEYAGMEIPSLEDYLRAHFPDAVKTAGGVLELVTMAASLGGFTVTEYDRTEQRRGADGNRVATSVKRHFIAKARGASDPKAFWADKKVVPGFEL